MAAIGQIGEVVFEYLRGPESLERQLDWSYEEHSIAGGKGVLEYTGEHLHQVKLTIKLSSISGWGPLWAIDPQAELEELVDMARGGHDGPDAHALIIGTRLVGDFVIEKIQERYRAFNRSGVLTSVEVELTLKEYQ